jgi:nucleoside-diphosphate-sugar epimerase
MVRAHHLNNKIHIAVIGGNGFIGRHFIQRLFKQKNVRIWSLDLKHHNVHIDVSDAEAIVEQVRIDIAAESVIQSWLMANPVDYVVYCAGCEVITDGLHPSFVYDAKTLLGLSRTLDALRSIPKFDETDELPYFMYLSSWSVYGFNRKKVSNEEATLIPANYSGMMKMAAEDLVGRMCTKLEIPFSILRPTEVYGRSHHKQLKDKRFWPGYVNFFVNQIVSRQEKVEVFSPDTRLDLVNVNYLTKVMAQMLADRTEGVFNVSSGEVLSLWDLASSVIDCYGDGVVSSLHKTRRLKIEDMTVDSSKVHSLVPYEYDKYSLDSFLKDYIPVRRFEIARDMTIEQILSERFTLDTTSYGAKEHFDKRQARRALDYQKIMEVAGDQFKKIQYAKFQERARKLLAGEKPKLLTTEEE